ncbi:MAG: Trk family potassium uptake protein, partial [Clostridia bacterium]|nr:Trk family potassium uptake protein [Clostridia bacterium]
GGVVRMTGFIFKAALIFEVSGALVLLPTFCSRYGAAGIWMSFFHSISAFCNAGFDVMGGRSGSFSSLTSFASSPGVVIPISLLIIIGGIGFLTWDDIATHKFRFRRYRTQTKVVLVTSGLLILIPAVMLFFGEYADFPIGERISLSLFQAITPRTAGFNTADLTALTSVGRMLIIVLMIIGGSPGSTAGGMKTTTIAVLFSSSFSVFRRKKSTEMFGRRVEDSVVKTAAALLIMYLSLALTGAAIISLVDGLPLGTCIFETASAIGTVGLTLGITPSLSFVSHFILILLMFFGRVGGLTLMYAAITGKGGDVSQRPIGKISVG